mmetsp:Transcript_44457/g.85514  ORF Transcript_44457/g.85514 Transcript_44457/m.85514 type:complete len:476 (-) Transcript_44457:41-1468(-)
MGNTIAPFFQEEDEEGEEQERPKRRWPAVAQQHRTAAAKTNAQTLDDDSDASGHDTARGNDDESSVGVATPRSGGGDEGKSKGSDEDKDSSDDSEVEGVGAFQVQETVTSKHKFVVKMEFGPLFSLHEALEKELDKPAKLWQTNKASKKTQRAERAALESVLAARRDKAKLLADWMAKMELEECMLLEAAVALNVDSSELRYAITSSKKFEVDQEDKVKKTLVLQLLECMESDIETVKDVLDKHVVHGVDLNDLKAAVEASDGELHFKEANGVHLLERVDIHAEMGVQRALEKEKKLHEKGAKQVKARRSWRSKKDDKGSDESSSSSDNDTDVKSVLNREAEKKALALRRLQVQRKIEEFLNLYTRGQNLQKINSKGQRYNRRVFVDINRRALVIQGASGPRFFPFINMKEIDIDTHTSKEGQLETQVTCAMEKTGRVYKELILCFSDQQRASTFVNCMTLFSQALRAAAAVGKK